MKLTFVANLGVVFTNPSPADIDEYVRLRYESMMTQTPRADKETHLTAALYVKNKGVFLCSVPDGPASGRSGKIKEGGANCHAGLVGASAKSYTSRLYSRR
ncbi:hypothetical protein BKA67DRAFT_539475 [Truncatella angustata]|uniref:Uncharacterized protein n=1 Tax=Truncatella angustata TaxID=152316 RepID=A0A9P8RKM3_9PEZI|nr:uncharacterized protein BKA67DRAFT_539475 [Truncatella angustata]KAH6647624.1 hypothetical protein BKA67DRAFT_539475 [Truncatella angustata]